MDAGNGRCSVPIEGTLRRAFPTLLFLFPLKKKFMLRNHSPIRRLFSSLVVVLLLAESCPVTAKESLIQVEYDVVYGEAGGQELLLDVYRPAGPQKIRPAVILVHGGGWSGGDKKDFTKDEVSFYAKQSYVCFNINYRLATKDSNKYPAQLDDVQRAVRWIRSKAVQYGIDPKRIGAFGGSAGGHLVALLGTRDTRDNSDPTLAQYSSRVTCVVDLAGPKDLTVRLPVEPVDVESLVVNFLGKPRSEASDSYREASPLFSVDKKTVPFLILHGTEDALVPLDQSERFYEALHKVGVEASLIKLEGEGHELKRQVTLVVNKSVEFFDRHLISHLTPALKSDDVRTKPQHK